MNLPMIAQAPPPFDAHCHFWQLSRGDYGWLDNAKAELAPIYRDFAPTDYPGPASVIAVQAAPTIAETQFLLDLALCSKRSTKLKIKGVVGWIDFTSAGALDTLRQLAVSPLLVGLRPMLQDIPDRDWLLTETRSELFDEMLRQRLCFDALVTERHLPVLSTFAQRYPELPIVIDHAAKPQPGDLASWREGMQNLARHPNVHCKLSGLMTELSKADQADPLPALTQLFHNLLDWFGAERLIWGSDWPVVTLAAPWEAWRTLTETLLSAVSPSERNAILRENGARFYGVSI